MLLVCGMELHVPLTLRRSYKFTVEDRITTVNIQHGVYQTVTPIQFEKQNKNMPCFF